MFGIVQLGFAGGVVVLVELLVVLLVVVDVLLGVVFVLEEFDILLGLD